MAPPSQSSAAESVATMAGQIMSTPVITVSPDDSVGEVAELLHTKGISGAPVVDSAGVLLGLVSEYDLLARSGSTARDVMTKSVISVTTDTLVNDVRHLLIDQRIRRLPVTDQGRLVGIVSRGDIVALLATEWVCQSCGEAVRGDRRPESCPRCHAPGERFVLQEQSPGF
ncbi:MAG: CBS domain-containing protein [Intrasporangium sp.]|uniref:CBS domain-containing protein n=1 Tax=Intrasporangium sp. TaxID=1925024 RepID=UPI002648C0F0|nr:CBS domain-containing protein [Intrasporangium sp.]MDN5796254.1 CBS domain-containing protein [Intrasporangium sp.]